MRFKTFAAPAWLTASVIVTMAAGASPALAESHPPVGSFGSFSKPNGIAVEESTGDVYVADIGTNTVYKFDSSGNPVDFSALGSNALSGAATPAKSFSFPEAHGTPAQVAVDNSTSPSDPSAGDLYVIDAGHDAIDKFSPTGAYLDQIVTAGEPLGLGVQAGGELRVGVHPLTAGVAIDVFDDSSTNNFVKLLEGTGSALEGLEGGEDAEHGLAVSPAGDDYALFPCGCIQKFGSEDEPFGRVDSGSADVAAAVDPATGHLYIDDQTSVAEYDTGEMNGRAYTEASENTGEETGSGALVSSFGSLQLSGTSGQGGIAVNGASGEIYVSSPGSNPGEGKVYVFASAAPAVAVSTPANVSQTGAALQGAVDPRGAPVSACVFEYGPTKVSTSKVETLRTSSYTESVPCAQEPAQIGAGTSAVAVSAEVGGLRPGLLYHFRLDADGANGESFSTGLFATAGAGFAVKTFEVSFLNQDGTPDTQAGSHPYEMVTNLEYNSRFMARETTADSRYTLQPDGNLKDVIVDLPPGLVGDPNATAKKCTLRELEGEVGRTSGETKCPAESQVGELEVEFGDRPVQDLAPIKEPIYNMVAPRGVAAQFGANFIVPKLFINAGVQAGGDYPVQASSLESPVIEPVISTRLTMFGVVGSGEQRKPFLTLPTGCTGPLRSTISTDSYQEPGHFVGAASLTHDAAGSPVALTGCSKLLFPPTITVSPDVPDASTSTGLTVGVHVSQKAALNPEGLAESALRDTTVTLPAGVAINPAGADGLEACSEGLAGFTGFTEFNPEFEPGVKTATFTPEMPEPLQPGSNFCPNASKIGTVKIKTPLLPNPLEGAVYLAAQNGNPFGSLVAMYMIVEDPVSGSIVKLTGEVRLCENAGQTINGSTCQTPGQIVTTFKNTPDLPFEELELHFFGGERAPLTTPSRCGTYTTQAAFTPWDGNGTVNTSSSFAITSGPGGSPCPGQSLPFTPSLTAGSTNINAGGFSPLTTTISREDGQQNMSSVQLHFPPGLSGLLSSVTLCGEQQANEGTCGPDTLIGETTVSAGVGSDPVSVVGGKVYITGKYHGAPFGLSIVDPVKAGPFDLEHDTANLNQDPPCDCVVVRAKIEVNPTTAALTVTTNSESEGYAIPHLIDGIPVQIKKVNVLISHLSDFTFNPTNCDPMSITGSIGSDEGASSPVSVAFQATNCASLAFAPKFAVSTSGKTSKANGASLSVKLTYPQAPFGSQANIKQVKVDLPKQLPSRLTTLQKACTAAQFRSNPAGCPAASVVGHAKAITPLLPVPLEGPAYFVSNGSEAFPNLIMVLQGYGVTIDLVGDTFISKAGITSSTFKTVPDQPVTSFELTLPEGMYSALAANGNLCKPTTTVTIKTKVTVKLHGRKKIETRKVKQAKATTLSMPTEFVAQNGAVIHQTTPVGVTNCPKAKPAGKPNAKKKAKGKKGKGKK